jgi:hypothetical protein
MALQREGVEGSGMQGVLSSWTEWQYAPERENIVNLRHFVVGENATAHDTISDDDCCIEKRRKVEDQNIALGYIWCWCRSVHISTLEWSNEPPSTLIDRALQFDVEKIKVAYDRHGRNQTLNTFSTCMVEHAERAVSLKNPMNQRKSPRSEKWSSSLWPPK